VNCLDIASQSAFIMGDPRQQLLPFDVGQSVKAEPIQQGVEETLGVSTFHEQ
jgi:hypothetical protein